MNETSTVASSFVDWRFSIDPENDVGYVRTDHSSGWPREVCVVYGNEDRDARGQLIAAAPDLLAALKEVQHHADDDCGFMVLVRAAIAKAEGRS